MQTVTDSYTPFTEHELLKLKKEIEADQVTAKAFLHVYPDATQEAVQVATAIKDNSYLTIPMLSIALSEKYSQLLLAAPDGFNPLELLNTLYTQLFPAFNESGVLCHE